MSNWWENDDVEPYSAHLAAALAPHVVARERAVAQKAGIDAYYQYLADHPDESEPVQITNALLEAINAALAAPREALPEDARAALEGAMEWAAKYPLGGDMDKYAAGKVYHLCDAVLTAERARTEADK